MRASASATFLASLTWRSTISNVVRTSTSSPGSSSTSSRRSGRGPGTTAWGPVCVVDGLELVHVEQHQGELLVLEHAVQVLVERAPVRQAGERVTACLGEGERELPFLRQRSGGEMGGRGNELGVEVHLD